MNGNNGRDHPIIMKKDRPEEEAAPVSTTAAQQHGGGGGDVGAATMGCGILAKFPMIAVLTFALIGVGAGIGFSYWEPDDMEHKKTALKWIGLVGDMFIRSLRCIVLPLVFVNVTTSVVDMMSLGKAGPIGWKTIFFYLFTTVVACILGIISSMAMKPLYKEKEFAAASPAFFQFQCNDADSYITEDITTGALSCVPGTADMDSTKFIVNDMSSTFLKKTSGVASDIGLSQTVYEGVFEKLITANIFASFNEANFAGVIFFAIVFGLALSRVLNKLSLSSSSSLSLSPSSHQAKEVKQSTVMLFLRETEAVLLLLINWVIMATPFAVLSLIMKAVGGQPDIADAFENVGYLVVSTVIAMAAQIIICYMVLFTVMTRSNPLKYLRFMIPCQTMAFACASSAATIPVTLKCVESTGRVPPAIAGFVIPLGATVNMDGGAIYFPCACIWLAVLNGVEVNIGHLLLLVIISTIGSIGTAPVPSASLVLIITAYNTVFNTTGTPDGFSFILAIDWFMDRLRTVMNVTGDTVVAGIVSHICPLDQFSAEARSSDTLNDDVPRSAKFDESDELSA